MFKQYNVYIGTPSISDFLLFTPQRRRYPDSRITLFIFIFYTYNV